VRRARRTSPASASGIEAHNAIATIQWERIENRFFPQSRSYYVATLSAVTHPGSGLSGDRRYGRVGLTLGWLTSAAGLIALVTIESSGPQRAIPAGSAAVAAVVLLAVTGAFVGLGLSFVGLLVYAGLEARARLALIASAERRLRLLPCDPSFARALAGLVLNLVALLLLHAALD
jgi:hypothetical protein